MRSFLRSKLHLQALLALLLALQSMSSVMVDAVPFRGGGKRSTDAGGANTISINNADLRNTAVELYFATGDEDSSHLLREEIHQRATALQEWLVDKRRALHRRPEVMYQEQETSQYIQEILTAHGIPFTTGWAVNKHPDVMPGTGGYGVVADIGTGEEPCILLRADIDALPIQEQTAVDFHSEIEQRMHACGHDGHTTMLLGAATILKSFENSLNGTVRIVFQPAEEGGAGAKRMIEEGCLSKHPKPRHAMGMHLWPTLPSGTVASRPGPIMAASERFTIQIHGVGGHAAMPHLAVDPIVAAAAVISGLQTIISRNTSPLDSGVLSVTKFHAGDAFNIIPSNAMIGGTIRALSTETLLSLRDRMQQTASSIAAAMGCNVTVTYSKDFYPPTINDHQLFHSFSKHVGALVSQEGVLRDTETSMAAEDFSFFTENIPSTFYFIGQGSASSPPSNYGLHHPQFAIDETVLPRGVELHVNWAVRALRKLDKGQAALTE